MVVINDTLAFEYVDNSCHPIMHNFSDLCKASTDLNASI